MDADQIVAISIGVIFLTCGITAFCLSWRRMDESAEERIQAFLNRV